MIKGFGHNFKLPAFLDAFKIPYASDLESENGLLPVTHHKQVIPGDLCYACLYFADVLQFINKYIPVSVHVLLVKLQKFQEDVDVV